MLDHMGFPVTDAVKARAFYESAPAPQGIAVMMQVIDGRGNHLGCGRDDNPFFWIGSENSAPQHIHFALSTDTFIAAHQDALAAGGRDNFAPRLRPEYHPGYFTAFVLDADGKDIEVVWHDGALA